MFKDALLDAFTKDEAALSHSRRVHLLLLQSFLWHVSNECASRVHEMLSTMYSTTCDQLAHSQESDSHDDRIFGVVITESQKRMFYDNFIKGTQLMKRCEAASRLDPKARFEQWMQKRFREDDLKNTTQTQIHQRMQFLRFQTRERNRNKAAYEHTVAAFICMRDRNRFRRWIVHKIKPPWRLNGGVDMCRDAGAVVFEKVISMGASDIMCDVEFPWKVLQQFIATEHVETNIRAILYKIDVIISLQNHVEIPSDVCMVRHMCERRLSQIVENAPSTLVIRSTLSKRETQSRFIVDESSEMYT